MQTYQLTITARWRPEVLERILRVIRHRGFRVLSLNVETNESVLTIQLTLMSERAVTLLIAQLEKLFDVESVTI